MATEVFANVASTTVTAGGTGAPLSGTVETWTVASSASFPAIGTGLTEQFHIGDPAADSEIILVTAVSGTTWTVTRGAESTTPVTHAAGFTVVQVISAGFLATVAVKQASSAGFTPTDPSSTTSSTLVMMGVGSTCAFTPAGTGILLVTLTGYGATNTATSTFNVGARYGTGTAPLNGDAVTGTRFGSGGDPALKVAEGPTTSFAFTAVLSLTAGTAYWFDVAASTTNSSDAAAISNIAVTIVELPY